MLYQPSATTTGGVQYSVIFVNNSNNTASACMYQQDPTIGVPDVMSLAWFAQQAAPTTNVTFTWTIDYSFVWSQTGQLRPGVMFRASQTWPADLTSTNRVTFTNNAGAYTFTNQGPGTAGSLTVAEDRTVATNAAVGVGMSGAGTFVAQSQPNWNLTFTPHPEYWITFGTFSPGEVMDVTSVSNSAHIQFPPNIYSMTATIDAGNNWTVQPTLAMNAQFVRDKRQYPELLWGQNPEDPTLARRGGHAGRLPSHAYDD